MYLPLAVDTGRLDALMHKQPSQQKYYSQISFVGKIYDSPFDTLLAPADDYQKGYLQGILQAQMLTYGYYFVDEILPEKLLEDINQSYMTALTMPWIKRIFT